MTVELPLPTRLRREWHALASRPAMVRRMHSWALGSSYNSLDELVRAAGLVPHGETSTVEDHAGNELLGRLVGVARVDDIAARVVLQRLLPGLCSRARRWADRYSGDWLAAFDDVVAAAWMVIRVYDMERRPSHVVANLLRDAEHLAFVKDTRRCWRAEAVEPRTLDLPVETPAPVEALFELADVVAMAGAALTDGDRQIVRLLAAGHTTTQVAAQLDISVRTLANRRDAAIHRLRSAVAA